MKRRDFIKQSLSASAVIVGTGYASFDMIGKSYAASVVPASLEDRGRKAAAKIGRELNPINDEGFLSSPLAVSNSEVAGKNVEPAFAYYSRPAISYKQHQANQEQIRAAIAKVNPAISPPIEEINLAQSDLEKSKPIKQVKLDEQAKSVQEKVANFEANFTDDVVLTDSEYELLVSTLERVNRVQDYVGFGNFNILSFNDALKYAKNSSRIGTFTKGELAFLEMLFQYDSSKLGFYGDKVIDKQTHVVSSKDVVKMPGTGHYVFRGHSEVFYNKVRDEVGDSLILTSGVRNIVKQYQLFMAKTVQASGNMSRASRSLAPPGYSYHAIGDFDVGQVGGGLKNFTAAFAKTDEFKRLQDLGYVQIRYTANNDLGVRYEPWHIRVV